MDRKPPAIHRSQIEKRNSETPATRQICLPVDNEHRHLSVKELVEKGCELVIDDGESNASSNKTTTSAVGSSLPTKDEKKPDEKKMKER